MSMEASASATPLPADRGAHAAATARTLVGYSLEGASRALGVPIPLIRDVESGAVELNTELQELMERVYGIRLSQLMAKEQAEPQRTPIEYDAVHGVLRVGTLGVRFRFGLDDNDVLLRGFSSAVRRQRQICLLYTSPSPRDRQKSRMPSSA